MQHDPTHLLVIDDDTRLRDLLQRFLSERGFRVTTARDAADARAKLRSLAFDLLIVDIMMPGESGLSLTRTLREQSQVPILLLTAMSEAGDRIEGLSSGADDYLSKPFEPEELVLRINAILRRVQQPLSAGADRCVTFGQFSFDSQREELRRGDDMVRLTAAEASLLRALARRPGSALSRDELIAESPVIANLRTVDVQMARLRRKIEENPRFPRYLQTVRGVGYVLMLD
jgi:two-component system, OmpR family, phosphate regulon response regulator OmpR